MSTLTLIPVTDAWPAICRFWCRNDEMATFSTRVLILPRTGHVRANTVLQTENACAKINCFGFEFSHHAYRGEVPLQGSQRLITRPDITTAIALCASAVVVRVIPARLWPVASYGFALVRLLFRPRSTQQQMRRFTWIFPDLSRSAQLRLVLKYYGARAEDKFQYLRERCPGGWHPEIRLLGREHLDQALNAGHGVILWVYPLVFGFLVPKKGLHAEGFQVTHLSSDYHGYTLSPFGKRFLNPFMTTAESRYVSERVIISLDGSVGYLKRLVARLRENRVVSITGVASGRRRTVPFLNRYLRMACGAPRLALMTNAALLPVYTVRTAPGQFDVVVGAPLKLDRQGERDVAINSVLREYAERLEPYVLRYPWQFLSWGRLNFV